MLLRKTTLTLMAMTVLLPSVALAQTEEGFTEFDAEEWAEDERQFNLLKEHNRELTKYFRFGRFPDVTALYRGDDWGWPIWAFALYDRNICTGPQNRRECEYSPIVHRLSTPDDGEARPRLRGMKAAQAYSDLRIAGQPPNEAAAALDLRWERAELTNCPSAFMTLELLNDVRWIEPFTREKQDEMIMSLHADTVSLVVDSFGRRTQFTGAIRKDYPSQWAVDFMNALDGCWEPATSPKPWEGPAD